MPDARTAENLLGQMIWGYRISQAIFVAVKLGIPDALKNEARSYDELAAAMGAEPHALRRLLVALTSTGILREVAPDRFAVTTMGALLQAGEGPRDSAVLADLFWPAYTELLYTIRTGRSGSQRAFGMPIYDCLAQNPDADAAYAARMTAATRTMAAALASSYDFSDVSTVVDVGGGQGAFLGAILHAHPHLRGILFDRAAVVAGAQLALAGEQVADRCDIVGGDFFESLPGGDVYLLKWVISEWADDRAIAILTNCRRAMASGGRVLVIDPLGMASNEWFNLQMLVVWNGGRVRSEAELAALFAAAALRVERVISTPSLSIVEGRAA